MKYEQVQDTKMNTDRCPSKYYANTRVNDLFHQYVFKFAQLYSKRYMSSLAPPGCTLALRDGWPFSFSRLFWLMTFLFLLPLIYTVLGSVIVAIKTAKSCNHSMKIKARDERVRPSPFWVSPLGPGTYIFIHFSVWML